MEKIWVNRTYANPLLDEGLLEQNLRLAGRHCAAIVQGLPQYKGDTGWLSPLVDEGLLCRIRQKAREVREDADVFIVVGVGGSNQAARAVLSALPAPGGPEVLYAGNSLSPGALAAVLQQMSGKSVVLNIIAKNFATLEPGAHFRVLRAEMERRYTGEELARRIIATGTEGAGLCQMAQREGYTFFPFPLDVGGRFSALTPVGLFPMLVGGADVDGLLAGAAQMAEGIRENPEDNPAVEYAALRNTALAQGYTIETLASFEPALYWFERWWVQLFGESEGKEGKGIYPACAVYTEDLHAMGQYMQEGPRTLMETFLRVERPGASVFFPANNASDDGFDYLNGMDFAAINAAANQSTLEAHAAGGVPCFEIGLPDMSAHSLGGLFYLFMAACAVSALMAGVNPFDQNGVEAYKTRMIERLHNGNKT